MLLAKSIGLESYVVENTRDKIALPSNQKKENLIVSVSDFTELKNPKDLIKALSRVELKGWKVKIFGVTKGAYLDRLSFEISKLGLTPKVELCIGATRSDIQESLLKAKVFIQTSRTECKPLAVSEARDAGCYIISSNVGDIEEGEMTSVYKDCAHLKDLLIKYTTEPVPFCQCSDKEGEDFVGLISELL